MIIASKWQLVAPLSDCRGDWWERIKRLIFLVSGRAGLSQVNFPNLPPDVTTCDVGGLASCRRKVGGGGNWGV
eukprot:g12083.t1